MIVKLMIVLALALGSDTGEDCGEAICMYGNDAGAWKDAGRLSKKQRKSEAKKQRRRKDVGLRVVVEGGRGSVFVDGRYLAGEGDHAQREVKPGKHEVEVRDGDETRAVGVLTISVKAKGVVTVVVHVDR